MAERKLWPQPLEPGPWRDRVIVSGIEVKWNLEEGTCTFRGLPVAWLWIDTTLAGVMSGLAATVGPERLGLALQAEERKSVESDWLLFAGSPSFEAGFEALHRNAAVAGWGDWRLVSCDRKRRQCVFRAYHHWEARFQKALGVKWGSPLLAGKLAGICSKLFETPCWSTQTQFITAGDAYDEFIVSPSEKNIEEEIARLLETDIATRADMAVALTKLREVESQLRGEKERYADLVRRIPVGIFLYRIGADGSRRFEYVSPRFCELLNLDAASVTRDENAVFAAIHPEDRRSLDLGCIDPAKRFSPRRWEGRVEVRGEPRWIAIECDPQVFPDGGCVWSGVVSDITDAVRAREALVSAKESAESSNRVKTEFLDIAAHELKTPLTPLGLTIQICRRKVEKGERLSLEAMDRMGRQVERLTDLVTDLLDVSRLERGGLVLRTVPMELSALVTEVVESFQARRPDRRILLEVPEGAVTVRADAARIYQVLSNFLDNALQYTHAGSAIRVKVAPGPERARVAVTDQGPGIPRGQQERLFTRFFRVSGEATTRSSGLGLGLFICRRIIELHGGKIGVDSEVGKGSTFYFEIPAVQGGK